MAITFDDGYANTYTHGLPVLEALGMPFTVFVTTGFTDTDHVTWNDRLEFAVHACEGRILNARLMGEDFRLASPAGRRAAVSRLKTLLKRRPLRKVEKDVEGILATLATDPDDARLKCVRYLTSEQISEMSRRGVAFGAHTVTQPILSRETPERVLREVNESKSALEAVIGKPIFAFAYPNGRREDYNDTVVDTVKRAGFGAALTSVYGPARPGDDPYEIERIVFDGRWPYEVFEARVSGVLCALRS